MTPRISHALAVVVLVPFAGCAPAPEAQTSSGQAPSSLSLNYAGWPVLTAKPIPVAVETWSYCRPPSPDDLAEKERKRLGPHFVPAIRVYANPAAHAHLREGRPGALPAGAVIIKEKLSEAGGARPFAFAAMIKREAGYDRANGDWEYLYDPLQEGKKVERGKLASCIECHRTAAARDYLFGTYDK